MPLNKPKYLIVISIILLLTLGAFAFYWWQQNRQSNTWAFVPDHAVMVAEIKSPLQVLQTWKDKQYIQLLKPFPYFERLFDRIYTLQQWEEQVDDFFRNKTVFSSLHVTARDNFDYLFYIPLDNDQDQKIITGVITKFKNKPPYRYTNRNFQGFQITEIFIPRPQIIFSFIIYNEVLIGSYTPFLVEDVIRTLNKPPSLGDNTWTTIKNTSVTGKSDVQLYVQPATLPRLMQLFASGQHGKQLSFLASFAGSIQLQVNPETEQVMMDGISFTAEEKNEYLDIFNGQEPQPISCTHLIPTNTALLYHWGFHDAHKLGASLQNYWSKQTPNNLNTKASWQSIPSTRPESVFKWMNKEIVLVIPENNRSTTEKLLFVQAKDIKDAVTRMNSMVDAIDKQKGVNPYKETYADVLIRQINTTDFPVKVFGGFFNGFEQCFYAPVSNYIVFANTIQSIKKLLDDIENQRVWAYSVNRKGVMKEISNPDNFSLFVHTARAWNLLQQNASPKWQSIMKTYGNELKKTEYITLQIRQERNQAYETSMQLKFRADTVAQKAQNKFLITHQTSLEKALHTAPHVVRNHIDKSWEVLVQDIENKLYLIDAKGKILWKKPLGNRIITDITQIDFYKNNKLQYLFATSNKILILDRNGNMLTNFPIRVADTIDLHTVTALDYDKNRDYRLLASDLKGNLFLYSKEAKLLEGWNPLRVRYRLNGAARHIRVKGKDYIIACQANGILQVLNRKGKSYRGFPIQLQSRINNALYIDIGIDEANTFLTALTDNGEISTFNLLGTLTERKQFYRPSKTTRFTICTEKSGKDWLITRHDDKRISILDKQGTVLFEKEYDSATNLTVQYYDFGADLRIIAITNPVYGQTHLYHYNGNPIGNTYIKNTYPLSMLYVENFEKLLIYRAQKQETGIVSLKIK